MGKITINITKSKAGHYTLTIFELGEPTEWSPKGYKAKIFKQNLIDNKQAAHFIAKDFIENRK
jgi:hypothetical protein